LLAPLPLVGTLNPYRYRGYRYDNETGLYYLQSRYYDPQTGRFISADGLLATTGATQALNLLVYCNNSPVNASDPTGMMSDEEYKKMNPQAQAAYDAWLSADLARQQAENQMSPGARAARDRWKAAPKNTVSPYVPDSPSLIISSSPAPDDGYSAWGGGWGYVHRFSGPSSDGTILSGGSDLYYYHSDTTAIPSIGIGRIDMSAGADAKTGYGFSIGASLIAFDFGTLNVTIPGVGSTHISFTGTVGSFGATVGYVPGVGPKFGGADIVGLTFQIN